METINNITTNMEMTYAFQLGNLTDIKVRFFNFAIERLKKNKSNIVFVLHLIEKWIKPQRPFLGIIVTENNTHSFDDVHQFWRVLTMERDEVVGACIIKQQNHNLYLFYDVNMDDYDNKYHDIGAEILGLY